MSSCGDELVITCLGTFWTSVFLYVVGIELSLCVVCSGGKGKGKEGGSVSWTHETKGFRCTVRVIDHFLEGD